MLLKSRHVEEVLNGCCKKDSLRVCCAVFVYGAKKLMETYPQAITDIKTLERISYEPLSNPISSEKNEIVLKKFITQLEILKKSFKVHENNDNISHKKYADYKKLSEQLYKENTIKKHRVKSSLPEKIVASFNTNDIKVPKHTKQELGDSLKQPMKQNCPVMNLEKKPKLQSISKSYFEKHKTTVQLKEEPILRSKYLKSIQSKEQAINNQDPRQYVQLAYSTTHPIDKVIPKISHKEIKCESKSIVEMTNNFLNSSIISYFTRGCTTPGTPKNQFNDFMPGKFTKKKSRIWEDKILEEESSYATTENNCNYSATSYTPSDISILEDSNQLAEPLRETNSSKSTKPRQKLFILKNNFI